MGNQCEWDRTRAAEAAERLGAILVEDPHGHRHETDALLEKVLGATPPRCDLSASRAFGITSITMSVLEKDLDPLYDSLLEQVRGTAGYAFDDEEDEDEARDKEEAIARDRLDDLIQTAVDLASAPGSQTRMRVRVRHSYPGVSDSWFVPGATPPLGSRR